MRATYLLSLTRQNPDGGLKNVACIHPPVWSSPGSLRYTSAFASATGTVPQVGGSERVVTADSATVPNVVQAQPRQYPYTRRVPDYDRMRYMAPEDMVRELRNPTIVVTEPLVFAEPRPLRPRKVDRANISAIVDYDWEVWRGGVRLVSTKQDTVTRRVPTAGQWLDYMAALPTAPPAGNTIELRRYRRPQWFGQDQQSTNVGGRGDERMH
ncbi:hypothetical protein DAEQUDRAFT_92681 [Daedalea quercina L-15889]|uniref:Uncharacterized protein n=1 Tax=Daedalea quercina L-15889 TaxID=1314783 RepID=A0A165S8Y9_9APHY|nr:hypothetical protein DAEQUDRAFT_92681 [Daedalea quercina L-15889]